MKQKNKERRRWVIPCDSIQTTRVKLADNTDADLLARAMATLGIRSGSYTHDKARGEVVLRGSTASQITQAQIAQAYSAEVVKSTAAKRGWKLKQVAPFKFQVMKGGI